MFNKTVEADANLISIVVTNGDGNLVGSTTAARVQGDWAIPVHLFVEPTQRGEGVGGAIVADLQQWVVDNGMLGITGVLGSPFPDADPAKAIQFYKDNGFTVNGAIVTWTPPTT